MRKILSVTLTVALLVSVFAGCNAKSSSSESPTKAVVSEVKTTKNTEFQTSRKPIC